jgi:cyclophilin family peptidyl-prolyl cis-trans isomerase
VSPPPGGPGPPGGQRPGESDAGPVDLAVGMGRALRPWIVAAILVIAGVIALLYGANRPDDPSFAKAGASNTCDDRKPEGAAPKPTYAAPPEMKIDPAKKYGAIVDTNCGQIVIDLDAKTAPKTVNNFVFLAREHFYDGLAWHRLVKGSVIQGGDPAGNGSGGPGYTFEDELPAEGYAIGAVAMANSGPGTNGSQFFIVTGAGGTSLPHNYSRFGSVTKGLEVAQKIETFAQADEKASRPLYMLKVEITESAG